MDPVRQNPIQRTVRSVHMCVQCIALCTIVAHNIAQIRPDNFPSYPPDNHHFSDDVYLREGGLLLVRPHKVSYKVSNVVCLRITVYKNRCVTYDFSIWILTTGPRRSPLYVRCSDGGFNSNDEDIDVFHHDCSHRSVFDPGLPGSTAFYGRPA